jgi:hypothetical protein
MAKIKSQGTDLFVVDTATTVAKLACITSFGGLGGARSQIDVSCFSSVEMEYEGGMANPGQITVGGIYDTADSVFDKLITLKDSGETVEWYLGGSDDTTAPTAAASAIVPPSGRTGITFNGYVADITWDMAANGVWKYQLVIQRSGPWDLVPAA